MTGAIDKYLTSTGQVLPQNHPAYVRLILESLALKYKYVLEMFKEFSPFEINKLHIIGGGSKNSLLNQFTANATGIEVIAGPSEATAIGNIMVQARAAGMVETLQQMRDMIAKAVETTLFVPGDTQDWEEAYNRFVRIIK